jgi:uncharacterized protein YdeI (YjbR/CyaY-like superfamily)
MTIKNIDSYIAKAKPFAQPILKHLRKLVHQACPDVEETIKWGFPHFTYKGILCSIAAFKGHCALTFWKGKLLTDPHQIIDKSPVHSMGHLGRLTSLKDLPADSILLAYLQEALQLNEEGLTLAKKPPKKKALVIPEDFLAAVKKNKAALKTFESFPPSKKKDYIDWITEAKQKATRIKRLATAVEWLSQGKSRNWKYE